ncbi:unnamed protein product, partial [Mesorhabditis spiculigera]
MVRLLLVLLLLADVGIADNSVTCALNTPRFYDPSTGCYPGPIQNSFDPDTVLFWEVVEGYRVYYVCPEPGHKVCRSKGKDKKSPDQFSCHGTADLSEEWFKRWEAGFNGECGSEETRKEDATVEPLFRPKIYCDVSGPPYDPKGRTCKRSVAEPFGASPSIAFREDILHPDNTTVMVTYVCEAGYFCSEGSGDFWPVTTSGPLGDRVGCWDRVNKPTPYSSGICVADSALPRIVYTASADLKRLIESRQGRLGYGVLFPRGPDDFTDFKPFHYDVACDVAHRPWHPVEGCVEVERELPLATVTENAETIGADWGIAFYETVLNNDGVTWTHVVYDDPTTSKAEIPAEWPHKLAVLHSPASRGIRTLLRRYVELYDPSNAGSRGGISGTPLDFAPTYTRVKEVKYQPEWLITTTTKSTTTKSTTTVSTQSTNATMATTMNTTKATTTTTTRSTTTERPWSDEELMHINSGILCMVALLFLTIYFKCKKYEAPPRVTWLEVTTPEDAHPQNPPKQPADMTKSARSSATV